MSDDEADQELLALMRQHYFGEPKKDIAPETHILVGAQFIADNSTDVHLDMRSTKTAASMIYEQMQKKEYSTAMWSTHELHPKAQDESTVAFIFTMDLLNFSFWSELDEKHRFQVEYNDRRWTGYWSLVAVLQRALDEGIPITSPEFWSNREELTEAKMKYIFRSTTEEEDPMLKERLECLREAGGVLEKKYDNNITSLILGAKNSAAGLVNLLAKDFNCFNDVVDFEKKKGIRILKRAQILVADIWACFQGRGYGEFHDIDKLTIFADYRIPQLLNALGCLQYNPTLEHAVKAKQLIEHNDPWEIQIRGCSIWCVELIRKEILRMHPDTKINAILIDFFLYDMAKERETAGKESLPHHRTRSIWY